MTLRTTLFCIFLLYYLYGIGQVRDDFTDGDVFSSPEWYGDISQFTVINEQLRSNGPDDEAAEIYLSTQSTLINKTTWEFYIEMDFSPSGSNKIRVYLASDIAELTGSVNGYFIEIGESGNDTIRFKRSDEGSDETVFSGSEVFNDQVRIKITRSTSGDWELHADYSGGNDFISEGTFIDNTYTSTGHFGVIVNHTSTRYDKFFFDDIMIYKPLEIDSVEIKSEATIVIDFDQWVKIDEVGEIGNYSIVDSNMSNISVIEADRDESDLSKINLTVEPLYDDEFTLTVNNLRDSIVEDPVTNLSETYSYKQLDLQSISTISDTEIQLQFNDYLDKESAEILLNYSIDNGIGNPVSAVIDPNPNRVNLTLGTPLFEGQIFNLSVSNVLNEDLNSEVNADVDFEFIIPLSLDSLKIFSANQIRLFFNKILDETSASTETSYELDSVGTIIYPDEVEYTLGNKYADLTFSNGIPNGSFSVEVNSVIDLDGNLIDSNFNSQTGDYAYLDVVSFGQIGKDSLLIVFNQPLDQPTAEQVAHYVFQSIGLPHSATYFPSEYSVILEFDKFYNTDEVLDIINLENEEQNAIADKRLLDLEVSIQAPTTYRFILINEIMADPTPSIGLPEAEYVELYNPQDVPIQLEGFTLNEEPLSNYLLSPNEYVLLTDNSDSILFERSNIISITSFDALTNTGETVTLKDQYGNVVDSVTYDLNWYNDEEKEDGGYSLELINTLQPCSDQLNWTASDNPNGGTPGFENSVITIEDFTSPDLLSVQVSGGDSIFIQFDEPVDESTMIPANFLIGGNSVTDVFTINYTSCLLVLDQVLLSESLIELEITGIADCFGNVSETIEYGFYYDITPPMIDQAFFLSDHEIALIFHEPVVENKAEDESNFIIENYEVDRALLQDSTAFRVHLSVDSTFSEGWSGSLTINGLVDSLDNQVSELIQVLDYSNDVDTAFTLSKNLLQVEYKTTPNSSVLDVFNYRIVEDEVGHPAEIIQGSDARSFQLAFEKNFPENEPVRLYIERILEESSLNFLRTPAPEFVLDTDAPSLDSFLVMNDSQLILTFDEKLDIVKATNSLLYEIDDIGIPQEVIALNYFQLRLTFDERFADRREYRLRYTGLSDLLGNTLSTRRSLNFTYDQTAPKVTSVYAYGETSIQLQLSEPLVWESTSELDKYELDGAMPDSISIKGPDSTLLRLHFETLVYTAENELTVSPLEDSFGNVSEEITIQFDGTKPKIVGLVPTSTVAFDVLFNKAIESTTLSLDGLNITDFEITDYEFVTPTLLSLVLSGPFTEGDSVKFSVEEIQAKSGAVFSHSAEAVFRTYFGGHEITSENFISLNFQTDFESIQKEYFQLTGNDLSLATLDGEDKGLIQLRFAESLPENETLELSWEYLIDKWNRRVPDGSVDVVYDTKPPEVLDIQTDFFSQLTLSFSEETEELSSLEKSHYVISDLGSPVNVIHEGSAVVLDFNDQLQSGQFYELIVREISDHAGNYVTDTLTFQYEIPKTPSKGDLLISELMVDPVPTVGLPEAEYLELYNASENTLNLRSLKLMVDDSEVDLPDYDLAPSAYVAFTKDPELFEENVVGLDLPTLSNTGSAVSLVTLFGDQVDSISYTNNWYGDMEKDDGGYSLELINPFSECPGSVNWTYSHSPSGGTPGMINSVYSLDPDAAPPLLSDFSIDGSNTIQLHFNEVMNESSFLNLVIDSDQLNVLDLEVIDAQTLAVVFNAEFVSGKIYQLGVSNVMDCAGNVLEPVVLSVGIGDQPDFNDLIITEIMADPEPVKNLPNSEYIELYNRSDKLIYLAGIRYSDDRDTLHLPEIALDPKSYLLLVPSSSVSQFEVDNKLGLTSWLSLTNAGESLTLMNEDELIFQIEYTQDWYGDVDVDGGVSLEMKDINNPCATYLNWGPSISGDGGTPGYENANSEDIPDSFGPTLENVWVQDSVTIDLVFDEILHPDVAEVIAFESEPAIIMHSVSALDRNQIQIKTADPLTLNQVYELSLSGVYDCNGNSIEMGQATFVRPAQPDSLDVIINEVLFNPYDGGVDFVEVYNQSDSYFDLMGWQLKRIREEEEEFYEISSVPFILGPNEFLALTEDTVILKSQYTSGNRKRLLQIDRFPSLPNEEGTIAIEMPRGNESDRFEYHEDYHLTLLESVDGVSLERIDFSGPIQDPNNWTSASSSVGFATPGYSNSQSLESSQTSATLSIEPKVFVPGSSNAAEPTFTTINYQFEQGGKFANVIVYNQLGQPVTELAEGVSLSTSGFLRWDGTDATGSKVRRGYYVVLFEIYDGSGNQEILKETVVVGR